MTQARRATRPAGRPWPRLPVRRSNEELRALARDVIQGRTMVTNKKHEIQSAFYMMTALMDWRGVDTDSIVALIGHYDDAVRGRAMNGYPIFTSMGFLHKDDADAFDAHMNRMQEALQ